MPKHIELSCHRTADIALQKLQSLGINQAEVALLQEKGFSVDARLGEVETLEHHHEKKFWVTVYQGQRTGSASSADFSEQSILETIDKACTIAQFAQVDPYAGLADPKRLATDYPNCELYHPWQITPTDAIALAVDCEKIARAFDPKISNTEGVSVSTYNSENLYLNTLGFSGEYRVSMHSISCSLVAEENAQMQRDTAYTIARNAKDLENHESLAKRAAEKTIKRLGARPIKTQTCPVIFHAPEAKSLLRSFVQAASGGNLYRKTSFLLDAMGKSIFPQFIDIFQEPHLISALGSAPFDREGVSTEDQHYIRKGELVSYVLDSYSARKLGLATTGNSGGVFNLSISSTGESLTELFKKMDRGLFVTELMGQGVNITTGDYSRGAAGFWIENGEIQHAVEEVTIAGNLKDIFSGLLAVGNDLDVRGTIRTGSILIEKMTVSGH